MNTLRLMIEDIFHTIDSDDEGNFILECSTVNYDSFIKEFTPQNTVPATENFVLTKSHNRLKMNPTAKTARTHPEKNITGELSDGEYCKLEYKLEEITLELKGLSCLEFVISLRNHENYHKIISIILSSIASVAKENSNSLCYYMLKSLSSRIEDRVVPDDCVSEKKTYRLVKKILDTVN
jgi:hypothetical protein